MNLHTMECGQDAAGLLSWSPRGPGLASAPPRSVTGRVGQDRLREQKSCYFAVLLSVCPAFASFFSSGLILELQAVLGWSPGGASPHHFQCCHMQVAEDWRGNEKPEVDHRSGEKPSPIGNTAPEPKRSAAIEAIEGARSVIRFEVCVL